LRREGGRAERSDKIGHRSRPIPKGCIVGADTSCSGRLAAGHRPAPPASQCGTQRSTRIPPSPGHRSSTALVTFGLSTSPAPLSGSPPTPSFGWFDGTCEFCRAGLQTSCRYGGFWNAQRVGGGQAEAVRVPLVDGTLVAVPVEENSPLLPSLLTLSDVYGTGYHAISVVSTARPMSSPSVARKVSRRSASSPAATGRTLSWRRSACCLPMCKAVGVVRAGGVISRVGAPRYEDAPVGFGSLFGSNVTLTGGPAPARAYIGTLLPDVLEGRSTLGRSSTAGSPSTRCRSGTQRWTIVNHSRCASARNCGRPTRQSFVRLRQRRWVRAHPGRGRR